jgi:UDP-N-acetylmuramoyl-tripeptide--D-alanyl-D-alanine ligase
MKSALDLVKQISIYKHKVVILGDMFELGSKTNELHRGLASAISKNNINMVLTIGKAMQNLFNELTNKKVSAFHFADRNSLKSFVLSYDFADSIILIKGSRGMKMEEFVTILKEIL